MPSASVTMADAAKLDTVSPFWVRAQRVDLALKGLNASLRQLTFWRETYLMSVRSFQHQMTASILRQERKCLSLRISKAALSPCGTAPRPARPGGFHKPQSRRRPDPWGP